MKIKKLILKNIKGKVILQQSEKYKHIGFISKKLYSRSDQYQMVIGERDSESKIRSDQQYVIHLPVDLDEIEIQYCNYVFSKSMLSIDLLSLHLRDHQYCSLSGLIGKKGVINTQNDAIVDITSLEVSHLLLIMINSSQTIIRSGMIDELVGNIGINAQCIVDVTIKKSFINLHLIQKIKQEKKNDYLLIETPRIEDGILSYNGITTVVPKDALKNSMFHQPLSLSIDKKFIYLNGYQFDVKNQSWEFLYSLEKILTRLKKEIIASVLAIVAGGIATKKLLSSLIKKKSKS